MCGVHAACMAGVCGAAGCGRTVCKTDMRYYDYIYYIKLKKKKKKVLTDVTVKARFAPRRHQPCHHGARG